MPNDVEITDASATPHEHLETITERVTVNRRIHEHWVSTRMSAEPVQRPTELLPTIEGDAARPGTARGAEACVDGNALAVGEHER